MSKETHFQAVINLRTGAIMKLREDNRFLLQRSDMREITARENKDTGAWEEVAGSDEHAAIAGSANLFRIGDRIRDLNEKRQQLIERAMQLSGGEQYLKDNALIDSDQSVKAEPESEPEPEQSQGIEFLDEGMLDVSEQLAAEQDKPARKRKRRAPAAGQDHSQKESDPSLDQDFDI